LRTIHPTVPRRSAAAGAHGVVLHLLVRGQNARQRLLGIRVHRQHRGALGVLCGRAAGQHGILRPLLGSHEGTHLPGLIGIQAEFGGHARDAIVDGRWAAAGWASWSAAIGRRRGWCGGLLGEQWGCLRQSGAKRSAGSQQEASVCASVCHVRRVRQR
jgi:hypothetical protein